MEIYERIRYLRKNELGMSQTEFASRLGVSRSVINNIELNTLANPEQKKPLYKLMCGIFNVSEEWLLHGIGDMYIEPDTFSLDDFVKQRGASELELDIVKAYFELDIGIRKAIISHFKDALVGTAAPSVPDTPEELEAQYPPVEDSGKGAG